MFERSTSERHIGHGGETSRIFTPTASISPSVSPIPAIFGNTAEDRQKTDAALDTSRTNTAGLLVGTPNTNQTADAHTGFHPPLDGDPASREGAYHIVSASWIVQV